MKITLEKKDIKLKVTQKAKDWLIEKGYDKELGARPLRRIIEQEVKDNITDYYLENIDVKDIIVDVNDN